MTRPRVDWTFFPPGPRGLLVLLVAALLGSLLLHLILTPFGILLALLPVVWLLRRGGDRA